MEEMTVEKAGIVEVGGGEEIASAQEMVAEGSEVNPSTEKVLQEALKVIGVAPGLMTNLIADLVALAKGGAFPKDEKWINRVEKAMIPLDVESRVRSQLYTSARKELDTAAMKHHRRTGEIKAVTEEDIEKLFQEKWDEHLEKKAEKDAKKKAFSKVD